MKGGDRVGFLREETRVDAGIAKLDSDISSLMEEFAAVLEEVGDGAIGEVKGALVEDWDEALETIRFPVGLLSFDRERVNAFHRADDRFILAECSPRPFEQLQFLRGSENLYMDLARPSAALLRFIRKIHGFYCDLLTEWARTEVDGLFFMDDWGSQSSLLISPKTWREVFKPLYRDYIDIGRRHGKRMFMHSDGFILDIVGDLAEMGLDALNSQIFCMGPERLAPYCGRLTFWGEIDRQHLLPHGGLDEVRSAVEAVHAHLWNRGGCIAQCEFGLGADPENIREVFRTWDRLTG